MRYRLSAGIVFIFMIALGSMLYFPLFTVHAQGVTPEPMVEQATPVPPTPTPVVIVIGVSLSVGVNDPSDPLAETVKIQE